jgi:hypothetical protein
VHAGDKIKINDHDAIIAKLAPGEKIDLDINVCMGTGQDHCKFSLAERVAVQPSKNGAVVTIHSCAGHDPKKILSLGLTILHGQLAETVAQIVQVTEDTMV